MKLLLIDGNSILNRAFYGIKTLTTKDGRYTNAVYGFMNILLKNLADEQPELCAIAFDLPGGTFRKRLYSEYKANRKGMPEELAQQLPLIKQLLADLGFAMVTCQDYEGDDILGTLSLAAAKQKTECRILTGDRDSLQLVGPGVSVLYATAHMGRSETILMDEERVRADYGVAPAALIDVKALMGDSSDNVPGVKGVGEKTALALIAAYGSLEGVYDNLDGEIVKPAVRRHLEEEREIAFLSRTLVTIERDAPVDKNLSRFVRGAGDPAAAAQLLNSLEMHGLVGKLGLADVRPAPAAAQQQEPVPEAVAASLGALAGAPELALLAEGERWYAEAGGKTCALTEAELLGLLSGKQKLITCEAKRLHRIALAAGKKLAAPLFDTVIAAYLLNPSASGYGAKELAGEYGVRPACVCAPEALGLLRPLAAALAEKLAEAGMAKLLEDIELPLAGVLAEMEHEGFLVDTEGIRAFGVELGELSAKEQASVFALAGHEFNLNSPKQLGEVLFGELELPSGKKTRTGFSTDAATLEALRGDYPIIDHILQYRSYQKLYATYVEGLLAAAGDTGRIHTDFKQTETRTGRISSANPNLQNIPIRTELGSRMRKFFVAGQGNVLLDADYSQIELRVLASVSGDENMISAFLGGHDIHTETAAEIFKLPRAMITPELRRRAKAVNFGIVYGIGAFSLSKNVGVSVKEASEYIENYLASYPQVNAWLESTVERAKANGYVTTQYGRRRYIPELANTNKQVQALGRRLAMNTPVQGTAADIIKIAMVRVRDRLADELPRAKLILQVHDELIVECPKEDAARASAILEQAMESAAKLAAPLIAEVHSGKSWYDAK